MIPQKSPIFTVECMTGLFKIRNDVDFIWIGTGQMKEEVEQRIESLDQADRFHLFGSRDDVSEILHCCNLFLLPSNFEGLGIVLIEAQASGLPCIIKYWVDEVCALLDNHTDLKVSESMIQCFSVSNMVQQMTKVFE